MIHRFIFNLISAISLCVLSQTVCADTSSSHTDKFISVADIHFNPFIGCKLSTKPCELISKLRASDYQAWDSILDREGPKEVSKAGEDTNYPLFKSTLVEIKRVNEKDHVRFAIVLGDFLAHEFRMNYVTYSHDASSTGYQAFIRKTLQFMSYKLKQALPDIDIYSVVGNNDSYTEDYGSVPHGAFYQETAQTWSKQIHDPANRKHLLSDFPAGGYYAVTLSGQSQQRIIILNTVLFSTHAQGPDIDNAAKQELSWLHKQLALAMKQKQHVLLLYHIPIGIDVYKTVQSKFGMIIEFWKPEYSKSFENELKNFAPVISAMLPAHIHMDTFQLLAVSQTSILPVNFTPAISPVFFNNPGFKVFYYNSESLKLNNFDTYYFALSATEGRAWQKEYSFNQIYQSNCKTCDLLMGMKQLTAHGLLSKYFKHYYAVGTNAQPITRKDAWIPYYWCNLREISSKDYRTCIKKDCGHL